MKEWVECTLEEATAVEINGVITEIDGNVAKTYDDITGTAYGIEIMVVMNLWKEIDQDLFPALGIKCLKQKEQVPMEFVGEFVEYSQSNVIFAPPEAIGKKFKCIEILEEEE